MRTSRSTETPMDFEFTSRPAVKPVWASAADDSSPPRKRPLGETNAARPPTQPGATVTFGRVQDVPFMLSIPPPSPAAAHAHAWVPPPGRTFAAPELRDVDMAEASPPRPRDRDGDGDGDKGEKKDGHRDGEGRLIATGGMKRVFRARQRREKERERERSGLAVARRAHVETEDEAGSEAESDGEGAAPAKTSTSNHYTLNLPAPSVPLSDMPYVLLGYLQFFFNLSLILVFLYLLIQFILTVQRDVEHRVSEYSMDIVQEIAQCALHFRTNGCAASPVPAMVYQCGVWETCMNRDPTKVGRAKVGAELIAEVVNGFVEPISWKTLAFTLTSLSFLTVFVNSLLSLYRARHAPANAPPRSHAPAPLYPIPSVGPYAHPALEHAGWGKATWAPAPTADAEELPSRRRRLDSGAAKEIKLK